MNCVDIDSIVHCRGARDAARTTWIVLRGPFGAPLDEVVALKTGA